MSLRPLIIGPNEQALIRGVIAKAAAEVLPHAVMKRLAGRTRTPEFATMNNDKTIDIPDGYRATYSHEEHLPGVVCRHLSISVKNALVGKGPNPHAVGMIMAEFGFKSVLGGCPMWLEDLGDDAFAVNIVEPVDGDVRKLRKSPGD